MASAAPAQVRCGVIVCIPSGIGLTFVAMVILLVDKWTDDQDSAIASCLGGVFRACRGGARGNEKDGVRSAGPDPKPATAGAFAAAPAPQLLPATACADRRPAAALRGRAAPP